MARILSLVLLLASSLAAGAASARANEPALKALLGRRGIHAGTAVNQGALFDPNEEIYRRILSSEFDLITPENHMKWEFIHPERDRFDFAEADRLMEYARDHGLKVRGHTLLWFRQNPAWLVNGRFSGSELRDILREHVTTVVRHFEERYPGTVLYWDVANEIFGDFARPRKWVWSAISQDPLEVAALAFQWAHDAAPGIKLFYNDYNAEDLGPKADRVYGFVRELRRRGVPIDGVGLQMHLNSLGLFSPRLSELVPNMQRLADIGLEVHITELDYMVLKAFRGLERQAQVHGYSMALWSCLMVPTCKVFSVWGFTDRYSWIPTQPYGKIFDDANLLDRSYQPKDPYRALIDMLQGPG